MSQEWIMISAAFFVTALVLLGYVAWLMACLRRQRREQEDADT